MKVFLDTNVLPQRGILRNPVMSAVLRISAQRGAPVQLPSIVVDETVNLRMQLAHDAAAKLQEALSQASKVMPIDDLYIPAPEEVGADWRKEIEAAFSVVPVSGNNAIEALRREALRLPPATDGAGSRDSAIWLTVRDAHLAHEDDTIFVSDNASDFGDPAKRSELHSALASELGEQAARFSYLRSLDGLIARLADPLTLEHVEFPEGELSEDLSLQILERPEVSSAVGADHELDDEGEHDAASSIFPPTVVRAYDIDGTGLALVRADVELNWPKKGSGAKDLEFTLRAWVELADDDPVAISVETLQYKAPPPPRVNWQRAIRTPRPA